MHMKLELVPIPVSDVDRAKAFYTDRLGFIEDVDVRPADGVRVVQLTPPASGCSIGMGTGLPVYEMTPGTIRGLHLVVADIEQARTEGYEVTGVRGVCRCQRHGWLSVRCPNVGRLRAEGQTFGSPA